MREVNALQSLLVVNWCIGGVIINETPDVMLSCSEINTILYAIFISIVYMLLWKIAGNVPCSLLYLWSRYDRDIGMFWHMSTKNYAWNSNPSCYLLNFRKTKKKSSLIFTVCLCIVELVAKELIISWNSQWNFVKYEII